MAISSRITIPPDIPIPNLNNGILFRHKAALAPYGRSLFDWAESSFPTSTNIELEKANTIEATTNSRSNVDEPICRFDAVIDGVDHAQCLLQKTSLFCSLY